MKYKGKRGQTATALLPFRKKELDFIINYDIKYRMGDELNEE